MPATTPACSSVIQDPALKDLPEAMPYSCRCVVPTDFMWILVTATGFMMLWPPNAMAEGYLGATFMDQGGHVIVNEIAAPSPAKTLGIQKGDRLIAIGGKAIKTAAEVDKLLQDAEPHKILRFDFRDAHGRLTKTKVELGDPDTYRKNALRKAAEAAEIAKLVEEQGPLAYKGLISKDRLGSPEIVLGVKNISAERVEAVEFDVALFNKFGEPVPSAFGGSHRKLFLYQNSLRPKESKTLEARIPWHETAAKATIRATRFVLSEDRIVIPPNAPTIEVSQ